MRLLAVALATLCIALVPRAALATDAGGFTPLGGACWDGMWCVSGFCADGVCCNTPCDGTCEACSAEKKQSGKGTGTCGPVRGGTDPDGECAAEAAASCGQTGQCAGAIAACALFPLGTACDVASPTQCQNGSFLGRVCTGQGACSTNPYTSPTPCGDYVCRRDDGGTGACAAPCPGHCASPCTSNADCADTQKLCLGGACVPKLDLGAVCGADGECRSGRCVDGLCCNAVCPGSCQACNLPGSEGTCTNTVAATQPGNRRACDGTGPCQGVCSGQADCFYPGTDTKCGTASCDSDSFVPASSCDGRGACATATGHDCGDYACSSAPPACLTSCTTTSDCSGGRACNTATHACSLQGATCDGDYAVKAADGTVTACNGYLCVVDRCAQQCSRALDCAPGYTCRGARCAPAMDAGPGGTDASTRGTLPETGGATVDAPIGSGGAATAAPSPSKDSGGCGCRIEPAAEPPALWTLLAVGSLLARRRRARSPR